MADLPMYLKRFEALPSALDIIRFLADQPDQTADIDDIMDGLAISERRFRKAMRRLITNDITQRAGDEVYQLTSQGRQGAADLAEFDQNAPDITSTPNASKVPRRLIVALPRVLIAGQPANVHIGFHADPQGRLTQSADLVLRLTAINARLSDGDAMLQLDNDIRQTAVTLTPGYYEQVRLQVRVMQLDPSGVDISDCGGLYVDVNVMGGGAEGGLVAFGTDVYLDT